ncbi:MAG: imidazole glycerol phosphate synthase subunit HisH [Pedobacter sp.]|uniref:imidazole glycerol phosphate synthase subunit HisH n=1 Tax=Pedobacter sp. TaxID=1411316 RepID=UPI0028098DF4|nr:imidazole glycerol phosphate synthase subunit HisH [Pedobacter sp.]MDQ8004322.1 imidazole glycerol phosphate synthase subunit HisH [Pedobacter sp.]
MIGIVDYGMGNLLSVYNAFDYLGAEVKICNNPEEIESVDKIVIPGVGAFKDCIEKITSTGFLEALNEQVIVKAKPTLGICLGMQVMSNRSFEGGEYKGLGWFDADVIRLSPTDPDLRVPNIGWNTIEYDSEVSLFKNLPTNPDFYLVHSFYVKSNNTNDVVATYEYTYPVTAAILKDNIFATQFHPEKSQDYGLQLLDNFIDWNP